MQAQDLSTEQTPESPVPVELTVDLRGEYLAGELIEIRLEFFNPREDEALSVPDYASRPWLISFEVENAEGQVRRAYATPPETDPGGEWRLAARARRQVRMGVPTSSSLPPGDYQLSLEVSQADGVLSVGPHAIHLARARPVRGALSRDVLTLDQVSQSLWLHRARSGYDLYLGSSRTDDAVRPRNQFLWHLDAPVEPVLTHSRPQDRGNRFLYWQRDDRTVEYLRLAGDSTRGNLRRFQSPYPVVEVVGRGSTGAEGRLYIPLWIPAPSGASGELRVAMLGGREEIRFRRVVPLAVSPAWLETGVDSSGTLRLLLPTAAGLDLYTVVMGSDLPAMGKRLFSRSEGRPLAARFGLLPSTEDYAGGLAVFSLSRGRAGVVARWHTLGGDLLQEQSPFSLDSSWTILDVIPREFGRPALLCQDSEGEVSVLRPGLGQVLADVPVGSRLALADDGSLLLRRFVEGGPVAIEPVAAAEEVGRE